MSMSATAHEGCVDIIKESSALKAGTGTTIPRCAEAWNLHQQHTRPGAPV